MKRLLLLRHAKSSWENAGIPDFERPLNARGLNTAPFMGELIARRAIAADAIVSSPAKRAMETALLVRESAGLNADVIYDERIYEASPRSLRQVVAEFSDEMFAVMLVGHNPGLEGFIRFLTGKLEPMPTAALAVIDLDIESWSEVNGGKGRLVELFRPKEEMGATTGGA